MKRLTRDPWSDFVEMPADKPTDMTFGEYRLNKVLEKHGLNTSSLEFMRQLIRSNIGQRADCSISENRKQLTITHSGVLCDIQLRVTSSEHFPRSPPTITMNILDGLFIPNWDPEHSNLSEVAEEFAAFAAKLDAFLCTVRCMCGTVVEPRPFRREEEEEEEEEENAACAAFARLPPPEPDRVEAGGAESGAPLVQVQLAVRAAARRPLHALRLTLNVDAPAEYPHRIQLLPRRAHDALLAALRPDRWDAQRDLEENLCALLSDLLDADLDSFDQDDARNDPAELDEESDPSQENASQPRPASNNDSLDNSQLMDFENSQEQAQFNDLFASQMH